MQGKERGERLAQGLAPGSPRPRWPSGHHGYRVLITVTCSGLWDSVKNREGVRLQEAAALGAHGWRASKHRLRPLPSASVSSPGAALPSFCASPARLRNLGCGRLKRSAGSGQNSCQTQLRPPLPAVGACRSHSTAL